MNRVSLLVAGLALGLAALAGPVSAQTPSETVADGGYSVADPSNPNVSDEGDTRVYGDIATGNSGGDVYGDPAALANIQSHDTLVASVPPPDLTPDDDPAPLPAPAAPAPADGTTTTTAETATSPGDTSTTGDTTTAAPVSACGGYGTWYDAQVAYESAGGLGGDPSLVQAVDADADGVACEELIVY